MQVRRSIAAVVFGLVLAGCGDDGGSSSEEETSSGPATDGDSTGAPAVDYVTDIQPIFNTSCTCHLQGPSGTMTAPFMTLNEEVSYGEIVGVASEQAPALSRIATGDPDASYMWNKINATHLDVGGTGTEMPPALPLEQDVLDLIEAWIVQGAEP